MVNIQIRGNLIRLDLKTLPENEDFGSIINSSSHIDFKNYIKKTRTEQKVIYQNTLPVIDSNCEIHVTSFENDNYYDEGYTFFRSNLDELNCQNKDFKIPLEQFKYNYYLLNVKYGYGAGFETEIMDLNYENFETEDMKIYKSKIFGIHNKIVHSLKLNYLELKDLGRNKFDFSNGKSFILKKREANSDSPSKKKLIDQAEVVWTIE